MRAAAEAGAETVTLCDTNGSSLPSQVAAATSAVLAEIGEQVRIGIHCHNDAECGVANSIAAVEVGARQVQGTVNGCGERTGNANLISIIANLQLKLGYRCLEDEQLARLTQTAHFVDELLNINPDPNQPYVGRNAFAHKGGMHVAGVSADATTFEHIDPALVGNERAMLVSELAGRASMVEKAASLGLELDEAGAARVLERVKRLEHEGYQFEAADGSLELLLRRETGGYEQLFELESWSVVVEMQGDGVVSTEATIRISIDGKRFERTARGNGPVNALDGALRAAIVEVHPHLRNIERLNYKVRIVDEARNGCGHARVDRCVRRQRGVGHDRRVGEPHRRLVGGARRLTRMRHAAEPRDVSATSDTPTPRVALAQEDEAMIPLARPWLGDAEERAVLEVLRSGQLSLGPRLREFEERFAERVSPLRERGFDRHGRASPGSSRSRYRRGRRGDHQPVLVRGHRQCRALRARSPVFADIDPRHPHSRSGRGRRRR